MKASDRLAYKASILHEQIAGIMQLARSLGEPIPEMAALYQELHNLYTAEAPLASLQDDADIIIRANGPAMTASPYLNGINWLFDEAQKQLKNLVVAAISPTSIHATEIAKNIPVMLTGTAPGSFYAGFKIQADLPSGPIGKTLDLLDPKYKGEALKSAKAAILKLTEVPYHVKSEGIDESIFDLIPDPEMRDTSLMAAFHLSPTGQKGINSVSLSTPNSGLKPAELTTYDRKTLRKNVVRPLIRATKTDSFIGTLRGIDLDKHRVMLRDVDGIGSLRCVFMMKDNDARAMLGKKVIVKGSYEENKSGKPSLLVADEIRLVPSLNI